MTAPDATAGDGLRSDEWWTQLFLSAERAANEVPYSAGVAYPHPHAAAFRSAVEPALRDVLAAAARDAELRKRVKVLAATARVMWDSTYPVSAVSLSDLLSALDVP